MWPERLRPVDFFDDDRAVPFFPPRETRASNQLVAAAQHCLTYPRHEYGARGEQKRAVPERQRWTKGRPE
jgi:hypothetical protein